MANERDGDPHFCVINYCIYLFIFLGGNLISCPKYSTSWWDGQGLVCCICSSLTNTKLESYWNLLAGLCFSYDAWVIYNFFSLCLAWVGGPGTVVVSLNGQSLKPSWFLMTCCLPAIPLDGCVILFCLIKWSIKIFYACPHALKTLSHGLWHCKC